VINSRLENQAQPARATGPSATSLSALCIAELTSTSRVQPPATVNQRRVVERATPAVRRHRPPPILEAEKRVNADDERNPRRSSSALAGRVWANASGTRQHAVIRSHYVPTLSSDPQARVTPRNCRSRHLRCYSLACGGGGERLPRRLSSPQRQRHDLRQPKQRQHEEAA